MLRHLRDQADPRTDPARRDHPAGARRWTTPGRWRARSPTARRCSPAMAAGGARPLTPLMPPPVPLDELPLTAVRRHAPLEGVTIALTDRTDAIDDRAGGRESGSTRPARRASDSARGWSSFRPRGRSSGTTSADPAHRGVGLPQAARRAARSLPPRDRRVRRGRRATSRRLPPTSTPQQRRAQGTAAWEQWFRDNRSSTN